MATPRYQSGFSSVELLLTLFIAAAFLMSGYQLYSVVINDSGEARQQSVASSIATGYLRSFSDPSVLPATCSTSQPVARSTPNDHYYAWQETDTLPDNTEVAVAYSCVDSTPNTVTKVEATVWYGDKNVKHIIYATK